MGSRKQPIPAPEVSSKPEAPPAPPRNRLDAIKCPCGKMLGQHVSNGVQVKVRGQLLVTINQGMLHCPKCNIMTEVDVGGGVRDLIKDQGPTSFVWNGKDYWVWEERDQDGRTYSRFELK